MKDLQQTFLADTPRRLASLRQDLAILREMPDKSRINAILRRLFQKIHTLKGSAAAFGLDVAARIAHEIESVLEAAATDRELSPEIVSVLDEGADLLSQSLAAAADNRDFAFPQIEIENWRAGKAASHPNVNRQIETIAAKPPFLIEIERQLNARELQQLNRAIADGSDCLVIAASFEIEKFAEEFQILRQNLMQNGEIIATLPQPQSAANRIGLKIICATRAAATDFAALVKKQGAEILFDYRREIDKSNFGEDVDRLAVKLSDVWATALLAGEKTAESQGKKVSFATEGGEIEIAAAHRENLEIAFLHLLRNAVAHGIESPAERCRNGKNESGAVTVAAERDNDQLEIKISDDGRGIDLERVAQIAAERGLLADNANLNDEQIRQLIFLPGFSTAGNLTAEAGRGVGLDAVESAIREIGGTLKVESEWGRGTTFEIMMK